MKAISFQNIYIYIYKRDKNVSNHFLVYIFKQPFLYEQRMEQEEEEEEEEECTRE